MPQTTDVFVARQPIFDDHQRVFAYELLFRSEPLTCLGPGATEAENPRVISNGMVVGLASLTDQKPAFVTFSRDALLGDLAFSLPKKDVVVEVLESVVSDQETLSACQRLKAAGYRLALADVEDEPRQGALADLVDFIKVDVLAATPEACSRMVRKYRNAPHRALLAERVETREALAEARARGYDYFQGRFFARRSATPSKAIPGFRLNYLRLLHELNRPEVDMRRLEEVVKQEASITFRLLRRVNSAAYGFRLETSSLRHALVLLGEREIRLCATVWAMADLARDTPSETVIASTLRARLCELLAPMADLADRSLDLFLLGMFSMLDAILDQPMDRILVALPLGGELREALLGRTNRLRAVLDCVLAYEQGRWADVSSLASSAGIQERDIPTSYLEAVEWTRDIFQWPA